MPALRSRCLAVFVTAVSLFTRGVLADPGDLHPADRFSADAIRAWAAEHGTPLYVYDGDRIVRNYRRLAAAFAEVAPGARLHYAIKANSNPAIRVSFRCSSVSLGGCAGTAR